MTLSDETAGKHLPPEFVSRRDAMTKSLDHPQYQVRLMALKKYSSQCCDALLLATTTVDGVQPPTTAVDVTLTEQLVEELIDLGYGLLPSKVQLSETAGTAAAEHLLGIACDCLELCAAMHDDETATAFIARVKPLLLPALSVSDGLDPEVLAALCVALAQTFVAEPGMATSSFTAISEMQSLAYVVCKLLRDARCDSHSLPPRTGSLKQLKEQDALRAARTQMCNRVTLAYVADMSTCFALHHTRDNDLWTEIAAFAVYTIKKECLRLQVPEGGSSWPQELPFDAADVKNIAFALSSVGEVQKYDALMEALVTAGLLLEPIPRPRAHQD